MYTGQVVAGQSVQVYQIPQADSVALASDRGTFFEAEDFSMIIASDSPDVELDDGIAMTWPGDAAQGVLEDIYGVDLDIVGEGKCIRLASDFQLIRDTLHSPWLLCSRLFYC